MTDQSIDLTGVRARAKDGPPRTPADNATRYHRVQQLEARVEGLVDRVHSHPHDLGTVIDGLQEVSSLLLDVVGEVRVLAQEAAQAHADRTFTPPQAPAGPGPG